jgi:DNA-directed RNA polymerase beta subunit
MQEFPEIDESQLRPIFDPTVTRQSIMDRTKSAFEKKFPLENDKVRLELDNVGYKGKTQFGISDTKKALMEGRRLSVPLHGDVRLIDKKTGQTLDERKGHLLANVPYMTDRGTFINKGTEYIVVNQSRLRPGIYTRHKDNGELEAHINVKSGTGTGMRMFMEPETGVYRVKVGDSQIKLMPILQKLGVSDDELKASWGPEVFEANRAAADDQAFEKFYDRLVGNRGSAYLRRLREDNAKDMEKTASPISEQDEMWYSALTEAIAKEAEAEISVEDTLREYGFSADPETGHYSLIAKAARVVRFPFSDDNFDDLSGPKTAAVLVPAKKNDFSVAVRMLEEARSRVETNPSQKQKENGNYRMGHVRWNGLDITIENPIGSYRRGTDRHGKEWKTLMKHDYGYVKGTRGKDDDHLDVFLGPHLESEMVFVIDQDNNGNGRFDEHKCVIGCRNQAEAKQLYLDNYQKSWKGFSAITPLTVDEFTWWAYNGDTSKPMSEQHTPKFAADYQGWVGFDLDGTLAYSEDGEFSKDKVGKPIEDMLELARGLVASGARIKIFTARAADKENLPAVEAWLEEHGLGGTEITNVKDPGMRTLFDDRAMRVAKNKGLQGTLSKEHMDYLTGTDKKGTFEGPVLDQLKQLKAFSDKRRYAEKNALARKLISAARDEYFIDSDDGRGIVGITHRPSGFRFHMPAAQMDPSFRAAPPAEQKTAIVKHEGGKWVLYTKDGKKVLGTHASAQGAYKQEYAIQKSQESRQDVAKPAAAMLQMPAAEPVLSYTPPAGAIGGVTLTKLQAHLGDEKVGEVFIRQQPELSHDRITNLFVSDKHRGAGIGRSIMERAIADYGKDRELQLRANPGFSQADAPDQDDLIRFYKTLGFATFDDQGNMKRPAATTNLGGIGSKLGVGPKKAASMLQSPGKTASSREFDIASLASEVMAAVSGNKTASADAKKDLEEVISPEDKIDLVRRQLERMEIDPEISQRNLGRDFGNVGPSALLETSRKLLMINRGEAKSDDRDSKANQTFHSVDDFLEERVLKDAGKVGGNLLGRAGWQGSLKALKVGHFTPQLDGLIVSNSLSQAVPGINPVELMDIHQKITQMGEGGIPSMDAVPMEARNVHISQLGVIDPIRTPESGGVGIDQRIGSYVRKGPNQQLFMPLLDRRTGKRVWRTPSQVYGKTLLFPQRVVMSPGAQTGDNFSGG